MGLASALLPKEKPERGAVGLVYTHAMRFEVALRAGFLCGASLACSSAPLAPPSVTSPESAGFDAVVLTLQDSGAAAAQTRAYGLEAEGDAVLLCADTSGFAVSADRRHVACESTSASPTTVSVYNRGQGLHTLGEFQSPVFSPAGDRLALSGSDTLFIAGADGSALSALPSDPTLGKVLGAAQWSSSGRYVSVLAEQGAWVWDVEQRALRQTLLGYNALSWLPGRDRLVATQAGELFFVDADGAHPVDYADAEFTGLWPGFSSSGDYLAYPRSSTIVVLNDRNGEGSSFVADIRDSWLDWSPIGDELAVDHGSAGAPELLFWTPNDQFSVPRPDDAFGTIEWSPDGSLLRDYLDEGSLIYDGSSGEVVTRLVGRLQWSPSGQNLFTLNMDDSAWLGDRVGGGLRLLSDDATRVTWFPDSQHLAVQIENELYVTDVQGTTPRLVATLSP